MFQDDTELLFPPRVIPALRNLRGESWGQLVDQVSQQQGEDLDRLAFVLLMVQLDGCSTCQADSFRAMRGCTQCATQTLRRYRGSDQELLKEFQQARQDVEKYLKVKKNE